jgi:hypothetical protein
MQNSKSDNIPSPTKELAISWIHRSMREIEAQVILNAWNVLWRNLVNSEVPLNEQMAQNSLEERNPVENEQVNNIDPVSLEERTPLENENGMK